MSAPTIHTPPLQTTTQTQPGDDVKEKKWQDCTACRLTGFATFSGLGAYALYEAGQQGAFAKVRPKGKPIVGAQVTAALGVVFLGLGVGRLFV